MAALSRQKQLNCKTPRFEPWIANSHNPTQKVYQRQSQLLLTNGNFATGRPSCQKPTAICYFSKADGRFSKRRPSCQRQMAVLSKPMAILSRPMAVLSSRGAPGARLSMQNQSKRQMPRLKAPMAVLSSDTYGFVLQPPAHAARTPVIGLPRTWHSRDRIAGF